MRSLRPGQNVLVGPEQVGRVILLLDAGEPLVVDAIGSADALRIITDTEVVQVNAAGAERLEVLEDAARPGRAALDVGRVAARANDRHVERGISLTKGHCAGGDTMNGAVEL